MIHIGAPSLCCLVFPCWTYPSITDQSLVKNRVILSSTRVFSEGIYDHEFRKLESFRHFHLSGPMIQRISPCLANKPPPPHASPFGHRATAVKKGGLLTAVQVAYGALYDAAK